MTVDRSAFGPILAALRTYDVTGWALGGPVAWINPTTGRLETSEIEGYAPSVARLSFGRAVVLDWKAADYLGRRPGLCAGEAHAQLTCTADELPALCRWAVDRLTRGEPLQVYAWTPTAWLLNPRKGPDTRLPASWRLEIKETEFAR